MDGVTALVLNAGSSSLKAAAYRFAHSGPFAEALAPIWKAQAAWDSQTSTIDAIERVLEPLWSGTVPAIRDRKEITVAGHRVVHGGSRFRESTLVTPAVRTALSELEELAPAHNRLAILGMDAVERVLPGSVPQVAVFDTAFHSSLPPASYVYPGPHWWLAEGIRRYGFHGISHQYAARRAARVLGRDLASLRLITCHLGGGCSVAAIRNGACVDTTMGFTPLEGLMMASRSGSIDPGIVLHLLRHGRAVDEVEAMLQHESGLLGISGASADMREIRAAVERGDERARLAFDVYIHRVRFHVGALLPPLGGLEALVFTGGVGENCAPVRAGVCGELGFLGIRFDELRNQTLTGEGDVSTPDSPVRVLVLHANEEWEIATECLRLAG